MYINTYKKQEARSSEKLTQFVYNMSFVSYYYFWASNQTKQKNRFTSYIHIYRISYMHFPVGICLWYQFMLDL